MTAYQISGTTGGPAALNGTVHKTFFLAINRAFLRAVIMEDRQSAVLYSRAILNILNTEKEEAEA